MYIIIAFSHTEAKAMSNKLIFRTALSFYLSFFSLLGFGGQPNRISFLMSKPRPQLIIFSADWCQPCRQAKNAIKQNVALKRIVDSYEVIEYNFDLAIPMRRKYKVERVPTFIVVSEGEEIRRQVGFSNPEKLKAFLD